MKNLYFLLFILSSLFTSNLMADNGHCSMNASFKYPQANGHYKQGKSIYIKVEPQKYQDIAYMELYVDGKIIRKETNYPYEWARSNSGGDHQLRNLKPGQHHIKVKIKTRCGQTTYQTRKIYVDRPDFGGHKPNPGNCQTESWFKYPKNKGTYNYGKPVYVRVDTKKYQNIAYMECYVDGKVIRKETNYPYEWAKGSGNSDSRLRRLSRGYHNIKVKIVDKCGKVHYEQSQIKVQ